MSPQTLAKLSGCGTVGVLVLMLSYAISCSEHKASCQSPEVVWPLSVLLLLVCGATCIVQCQQLERKSGYVSLPV